MVRIIHDLAELCVGGVPNGPKCLKIIRAKPELPPEEKPKPDQEEGYRDEGNPNAT